MFNIHSVEIDWGGRPLKLETGKVARQADGAVVATYGETVVLATVVAAKAPREGVDFLPSPSTTKKRPTRPAAFPAATSSVKAVRPRRRRWSPV